MTHDDDFADLDRMLAALPLEDAPVGLRARILTATVYRPEPAMKPWEIWLIGTFVALAVWLGWLVATAPYAGERFVDTANRLIEMGGLTSVTTFLWLAVGVSAAWWVSQLTFPSTRRIRIR
ncbi:MAG: hypothetical protein QOJ39_225 [Candidatus Eremiobacteraeota bacterium]|jgi:hypothetical protein|nr:hypothetical protein [Candidatus Eremiobacteraeota bacterium]